MNKEAIMGALAIACVGQDPLETHAPFKISEEVWSFFLILSEIQTVCPRQFAQLAAGLLFLQTFQMMFFQQVFC